MTQLFVLRPVLIVAVVAMLLVSACTTGTPSSRDIEQAQASASEVAAPSERAKPPSVDLLRMAAPTPKQTTRPAGVAPTSELAVPTSGLAANLAAPEGVMERPERAVAYPTTEPGQVSCLYTSYTNNALVSAQGVGRNVGAPSRQYVYYRQVWYVWNGTSWVQAWVSPFSYGISSGGQMEVAYKAMIGLGYQYFYWRLLDASGNRTNTLTPAWYQKSVTPGLAVRVLYQYFWTTLSGSVVRESTYIDAGGGHVHAGYCQPGP